MKSGAEADNPSVGTAGTPAKSRWSVYVLRCGDGSLYTGIAIDVRRRIAQHEGGPRGSKYLRGRGPLRLVFQAEVGDRGRASRAELRIKQLAKDEKEWLVLHPGRMDDWLARTCAESPAGNGT